MALWLSLLYVLGAVLFWVSHKSESLKREFLLGAAWPIVVPVILSVATGRRILASLQERRARRVQARAMHESELRAREQHFIDYAATGTAKWITDAVAEGEDKTNRKSRN